MSSRRSGVHHNYVAALALLVASGQARSASGKASPAGSTDLARSLDWHGVAEFAARALWVDAGGGQLLRFDSKGEATTLQLPDSASPRAIVPRGGDVDVVTDTSIIRISGSTIASALDFGMRVKSATALADGHVVLDEAGHLLRFRPGAPPSRIELHWAKDTPEDGDRRGSDLGDPGGDGLRRARMDKSGCLVTVDADHVAFVSADPYRIVVIGLDGDAREVTPDESLVKPLLGPELNRELRKLVGGAEPGSISVRVRSGHMAGARLIVDRQLVERIERDGVALAVIPCGVLDVIDLTTGTILDRVLFNHEPRGLAGKFVGTKGDSTLVFYQSEPVPPATKPRLVYADLE